MAMAATCQRRPALHGTAGTAPAAAWFVCMRSSLMQWEDYGVAIRTPRQAGSLTSQQSNGIHAMPPPISLIGAPTDIGAGVRGASMGPEALRVAGLVQALQAHGLAVHDRGNLAGPPNPWLPPENGYRHLAEVVAWNRSLHEAVYAELALGRLPIVLGGDHCLGVGSISAVARHCRERGQRLRVLWLDAHADFNTNQLTPSGNLHGMPVACLCGHGPQELIEIGGTVPALNPKSIRQIGIRSVDPGEKRFVLQAGLEVFDMRFIDEHGMRHAMELALATLDANTHLHVSFDVDFLDPEIAPGVGTTVPGGPTYREAQLCMEMIADTGRLASLDVMELNPALDVRNKTAALAVDLIESLFGKSTLMRDRA
jgi:arginase